MLSLPEIIEVSKKARSTNDMLRTALTHCLKHYEDMLVQSRALEMQLIETRATVQALNSAREDDARTMRKLVSELNAARNPRKPNHPFTVDELKAATDEYCKQRSRPGHEVRAVSRDKLIWWLRNGKPEQDPAG